jgi:hypothetical protein
VRAFQSTNERGKSSGTAKTGVMSLAGSASPSSAASDGIASIVVRRKKQEAGENQEFTRARWVGLSRSCRSRAKDDTEKYFVLGAGLSAIRGSALRASAIAFTHKTYELCSAHGARESKVAPARMMNSSRQLVPGKTSPESHGGVAKVVRHSSGENKRNTTGISRGNNAQKVSQK